MPGDPAPAELVKVGAQLRECLPFLRCPTGQPVQAGEGLAAGSDPPKSPPEEEQRVICE